jgi:hypothetical protein
VKSCSANAAIGLALCLWLASCSSTGRRPLFAGSAEIVELNVLTAPVGLDLDGKPGLDGFSIRVFAGAKANPKPVPIRAGTLEIVMFDGTLFGRTNLPPPLRVWTFTPDELRQREFTSGIGTGYDLLLAWGRNVPTRRLITVGARYTSPSGNVLTSSPSSVTVIDRQRSN